MELNPTSYVVLGMLRHEPRSGYEIKQIVDRSTRNFWAASYGQIYPELRRLAKAGLVEGEARPTGGRKRTVYRLTDAGRERLALWLDEPPEVWELRDESMLKLFFAAAAEPGRAIELVEARRRLHLERLEALRELEPKTTGGADPFPNLVLRCGLDYCESAIAWCDRALAELGAADVPQPRRSTR